MTRTTHPYDNLPAHKFWKSGVAEKTPQTIETLFQRRFKISKSDRVATAGSCFAQHVARHMKGRGFTIVDVEPPLPGMTTQTAQRFGFCTYSARYANIYTIRQLRQLVEDAMALQAVGGDGAKDRILRDVDVMERDGAWFDGLRPNVEPEGMASPDEVKRSREAHLRRVHKMFTSMDVFVFTFGLTETWRNKTTGTVYPICPGVLAGTFDPECHEFYNMTHADCMADFDAVYHALRAINPGLRFLTTVSPVPLTATASDMHVLSATTYSKSVLRAVCGEIVARYDDVDYFPSYELITAPFTRGAFFEENMRSVAEAGVENVMRIFFAAHDPEGAKSSAAKPRNRKAKEAGTNPGTASPSETKAALRAAKQEERRKLRQARRGARDQAQSKDDLVCEEELLDAFRK